jgi:hypothetical protein
MIGVMRPAKSLSLAAHNLVDVLAGLALMLAPTAVHLGTTAQIASVLLGVILTSAGLGLTALRPDSIVAHTRFDAGFVLVVAGAAFALALSGQLAAVLVLSAVVMLQAALGFNTRYAAIA